LSPPNIKIEIDTVLKMSYYLFKVTPNKEQKKLLTEEQSSNPKAA
jgi:hypothetical protein